jgi:hypothetical protein
MVEQHILPRASSESTGRVSKYSRCSFIKKQQKQQKQECIHPTPRYARRTERRLPIYSPIHHVPASASLGFLAKFSFSFKDFFSGGGGGGGAGSGETMTGEVESGGGRRLNCFIVNRSGCIEPLALRSASGRSEGVFTFSDGVYFGMSFVRTFSV